MYHMWYCHVCVTLGVPPHAKECHCMSQQGRSGLRVFEVLRCVAPGATA